MTLVPVGANVYELKELSDTDNFSEGVAEGSEQINEYRDRMYQYIKSIVPTWPEYIVKDWLYANQAKPFGRQSNITPADRSFETLRAFIPELLADIGLTVDTKWQLVPNMKFTMDMWEPKTKQRLIARAGGKSTELVPSTMAPNMKDAERHATQAALAKQQGGVRKEPVIIIKTPQGYELLEGWHRTIQHFAKYPDGYTGPAYVAVAQGQQGVAEDLSEAREGTMREIIHKALPDWPDYVIKDWISARIKDQSDLKNLQGWMVELGKMVQPNSWKLHKKMFLTFDMLAPKTRYFMKTKRQFGARNPFMVPRDAERSENAEQLVKTKGMENLPPVIMLQHSNGLELCEGWHRTMAAFRLHPEGFYVNAWVGQAQEQGVTEAEGTPTGVPHMTKKVLRHIIQQAGTEGAHAIVKSLE